MWKYNYTSELYHYGVPGMKWGVRRFQKRNGELTSSGKKRYNNQTPNKSKHRQKLENSYRELGMSKREAELAADKKIRTEKILAGAAVLTVSAAAAYVVHKKLKTKCDGVIKAGKHLQRVEMQDTQGKLHDVFYAAHDKSDKHKYAWMLGVTRKAQTGKSYIMNIGVNKDIKIAGRDKAVKTFEDLYKNDSDFRRIASTLARTNVHGGSEVDVNITSPKNMKRMYDNFNSNLVRRIDNADNKIAIDKFYNSLKQKGYGAVRDVNDMKFSGYKAKNPLIIFGQQNNVMTKTFRELNQNDISKNMIKDGVRGAGSILGKFGTVAVPATAVYTYIDAPNSPSKIDEKRR